MMSREHTGEHPPIIASASDLKVIDVTHESVTSDLETSIPAPTLMPAPTRGSLPEIQVFLVRGGVPICTQQPPPASAHTYPSGAETSSAYAPSRISKTVWAKGVGAGALAATVTLPHFQVGNKTPRGCSLSPPTSALTITGWVDG